MSPRRLLVVIDEMEVGGSQRQIVHLLTGIDRSRWQPELAYFRNDSFLIDQLRGAGVPVHLLPKRGRFDARFLWNFARFLRRNDYHLIHAFSLTAELWATVARIASGRRPPLIVSERNQQLQQPAWYWWLKRFVLARSTGAIANSDAGANTTARRTGIRRDFFDLIPNGVQIPPDLPPAQRDSVRRDIGAPPSKAFALFVGRLVPQKNLECLITAVAMLAPDERPWLAIAGDGPLLEHAQELAVTAGIRSNLHFLGERTDTTRLMQAADFLVLPSHFEGLSNALLEAMAAGCPVIASAVGGNPELISDEDTGLLFPANDAAALARCIVRLCADSTLRTQLSERARAYVSCTYGVAALVANTQSAYERCLGERKTARLPLRPGRSVSRIAGDGQA